MLLSRLKFVSVYHHDWQHLASKPLEPRIEPYLKPLYHWMSFGRHRGALSCSKNRPLQVLLSSIKMMTDTA